MLRGQESPLWCSAAVAQTDSKDPYDGYQYLSSSVNGNEDLQTRFNQEISPNHHPHPHTINPQYSINYQSQDRSPDLQLLETVKPGQLITMQTLKEDFTWDAPMPDDALTYIPKRNIDQIQESTRSRHNTLTLNQQDSFESINSEDDFFNQPTHDRRSVSFGGTSQFARRFNRHNTYNPNLLVVRSQSGSLI